MFSSHYKLSRFIGRSFVRRLSPILYLLLWGCPGGNSYEEDTVILQDLQFNYHQGLNTLYFSVEAEPSFLGKSLQAVNVLYFGFDTTQTADTLILNDLGIAGDIIAGDDVFAIKINNDTNIVTHVLKPSDTGFVYVEFLAQYETEIKRKMIGVKTGNYGPSILTVSMPDTMRLPGLDSLSVGTIVVTVDDPNGHEDVQICYLMFKKPNGDYSSGSPISLYDDGNKDFSMYLWDEAANDGKFSRYIVIDSNNLTGEYTSEFYVRDYSGILSEPFIVTMIVIP